MEYSYKFRIYPNREQQNLIQRTFGCCRFVYNHYLDQRKKAFEETGETLNYYDCCKDLTALKRQDETIWLKEADATSLQSSLQDLDDAYKNFFRRAKQGKAPGFPRFKSKHNHRQSYKSKCVGTNIKIFDNAVQLPKLGKVKCRISRKVEGRILFATVSQNPSGKYFVAFCCTDIDICPLEPTGKTVGVDFGVHDLVVTSDGVKYSNSKALSKATKKLARLQRQLSRKTKGSCNRNKARIEVARLHERIANIRNDTLHKLSTELIRSYDVICIEDLATKEMLRNHFYAKSVADASLGEFRRMLEYKAKLYGRTVCKIDRFYPSSQLCSDCGSQWSGTKDLAVRKWTCPICGSKHDRDINAAINILNEGLRLLA